MNEFERDDPEAPVGEPGVENRALLRKSPSAFRTISEVADELHIPQHVLRFWETRFPQVKPLKRGGGRRYYRPDDIALLRSISHLLYIQGYTIKGVQRLLREGGGLLADDIPPASDMERLDADAEGEFDFAHAAAAAASGEAPAQASGMAPKVVDGVAPEPAREGGGWRPALREVLAELEAIRALLPG